VQLSALAIHLQLVALNLESGSEICALACSNASAACCCRASSTGIASSSVALKPQAKCPLAVAGLKLRSLLILAFDSVPRGRLPLYPTLCVVRRTNQRGRARLPTAAIYTTGFEPFFGHCQTRWYSDPPDVTCAPMCNLHEIRCA
jgi:hypothetical protein